MDLILVTGGAGFIGSNFLAHWIARTGGSVVNADKLTYAGNLNNLERFKDDPRHIFVAADIADPEAIAAILSRHRPWAIINFAAESHVDRSIRWPEEFVH